MNMGLLLKAKKIGALLAAALSWFRNKKVFNMSFIFGCVLLSIGVFLLILGFKVLFNINDSNYRR